MSRDRRLRTTFDSAAARYRAARPGYPDELYADLLALTGVRPPARLLEVGCGPGTATLPLARRGFRITAVELGAALAAEARRDLAGFPQVSVVTSSFEEWRPPEGSAPFDLVYAATAWWWVDPDVKYAKAAALLRPGGHLAVWGAQHAFPAGFDPFFTDIQRVYGELGEAAVPWPPPPPEEQPDPAVAELAESGRFEVVGTRRYVWGRRYTAEEYIALLDTFSGHIAMEPAKREHLYREIRRRLAARPGGRLTRHWYVPLTVGRRR
jgi:SAM-dependent methyltransferase